ncbi:MAG: hypothetical protein IJA35_00090 [Clostridia bacterium]|nr:hypothetical protein [Clostridia bacterium]
MKSNICQIEKGEANLRAILKETDKVAVYNELKPKSALRLRLLSEELLGMLSGLFKNFEGLFWIETEGLRYELHVSLKADKMSSELRDDLVAVSKNKKNAAAVGITGKIRSIVDSMILYTDDYDQYAASYDYFDYYVEPHLVMDRGYSYAWSLERYRTQVNEKENTEAWDELEKSIIANLADDVLVGVKGKQVDIVIKKTFS